ncbi:hypothetical protein QJS04_geneDACA008498 [Acorus gramineus]|uniref:Uncharacterized protein n=1 Tax=Acorus gramineus TaxID=55184 RepID=A0AAV9AKA0_ACOGR|nr:hypothetical protein QJS04_geneDACA008498 [Acorus gramineus]
MWGQVEDSMGRAGLWKGFAMVPDVDGPTEEGCVRERLKRHRVEMSGRVWIPEMWGQEELMNEWADFSNFDGSLVPNGLMSAREALMGGLKRQRAEMVGRRAGSGGLRIKNPC